MRSRTAVPAAAPSKETFATSAASACTHAERPGTAATARSFRGSRDGTSREGRARGRERRVRRGFFESRESRRRAAREKRISTKLGAASRGASRATRDARRDPPETARRRATPPRALHDGRAGGFGAVPRRPGRSRSPAGRLGGVTKTLEMGFRSPRKGGGGNRGCASETRRRAGSEPRDAPRLFPSVTLRPATAAFAESEREEVMDAMLPRTSVAKNGARRASTCLFIRRSRP